MHVERCFYFFHANILLFGIIFSVHPEELCLSHPIIRVCVHLCKHIVLGSQHLSNSLVLCLLLLLTASLMSVSI